MFTSNANNTGTEFQDVLFETFSSNLSDYLNVFPDSMSGNITGVYLLKEVPTQVPSFVVSSNIGDESSPSPSAEVTDIGAGTVGAVGAAAAAGSAVSVP